MMPGPLWNAAEGCCSSDVAVLTILGDVMKTFQSQFQFQIPSVSVCTKTVREEDGILQDAACSKTQAGLERGKFLFLCEHCFGFVFCFSSTYPELETVAYLKTDE